MNGSIVAKLPGQVVPLAATAHLVDDAVESRPLIEMVGSGLTLRFCLAICGSFQKVPTDGYRPKLPF